MQLKDISVFYTGTIPAILCEILPRKLLKSGHPKDKSNPSMVRQSLKDIKVQNIKQQLQKIVADASGDSDLLRYGGVKTLINKDILYSFQALIDSYIKTDQTIKQSSPDKIYE